MERMRNLEQINKDISGKLLDSIYLLDVLESLIDGEARKITVLQIIKRNIKSAFNEVSQCRNMISFSD